MNDDEKATKRGWCIDYALRLQPKKARTAEQILNDAKKFEQYVLGAPPASVLSLAKSDKQ